MAIIGRTSQPTPETPTQEAKPQKGWWKKAIDVLTIGEQFSSGVLLKNQDENFLQAGMRGVKEDLSGIDVAEKGFEKTMGRKPENLVERAQVDLTGVVIGNAIDPLTYIGLGPLAKVIGGTSKFALRATGAGKLIGRLPSRVGKVAGELDDAGFATKYLADNADKARVDYMARIKGEFNNADNVVSADEAKYVIPGFSAEKSASYHEASSSFAKDFGKKLLDNPGTKDRPAIILAGGSGAGKTVGLKAQGDMKKYAAIFDTNSATAEGAMKRIDDVLDSGREAKVVYTYRDPIDAFENGVVPRGVKHGRVVPLENHISTHWGSLKTIEKIAQKYGDKVNVAYIDNTLGAGKAKLVESLDKVNIMRYTKGELKERLYDTFARKIQDGTIPEKQIGAYLANTSLGDIKQIEQRLGPAFRGLAERFGKEGTGLLGKLADSPVGYKALTWFNQAYDINPNVRKALFRATTEQELSKGFARSMGGELKEITKKLTPAQNRSIVSYLTGQTDELPQELNKLTPLWDDVRQKVDDVGLEAVQNGLLDVETYKQGMGRWLPKMYDIYDGNKRTGLLHTFFGKGASDELLERYGILRTLSKNVLNEFRNNVNAKIAQSGGGGDLLRDMNIYNAKSWDDLKDMLKNSDNMNVKKWYRANKGIVDEALSAYKKLEKRAGLGMYESREIARQNAVGAGKLNLGGASFKQRHGYIRYQDGDKVVTKNLLEEPEFDALLNDLQAKGKQIIDSDRPVSRSFQEAMGVIEDPAILVEKALERGRVKVPIKRLFDAIKQNEIVLDTKSFTKLVDSKGVKAHQFTRLPEDADKYGELAGKWVKKSVAENVLGTEELSTAVSSGPMQEFYKGLLQAWKSGVTVMNPASHMRQFMSNIVFLDMKLGRGPIPGASIAGPLTKTATQFSKLMTGKVDDVVKEAEQAGLFMGTFGGTDFGAVKSLTNASKGRVAKAGQKVVDFAADVWSKNDNFFRMAAYNYYRNKGLSPENAVAEAHKVFFNYSDVPKAVKFARDYIPFLTFGYKSSKFFGETLYHNPQRILQWYRLENAVSRLDPKNATVNPEDMRDYLQDQVPLYVDGQGRQKRLSMQYIYPWGSITSSNPLGTFGVNPFIKEAASQSFNYDPFFQQPITNSNLTGEALQERGSHAARSLVPGFRQAENLYDAATGQEDTGGRQQGLGQEVLSQVGGIKTSTIDLSEERKKVRKSKKARISSVQREISEIRKDKSLSQEKKSKKIQKLRQKIRDIRG